MLKNVSGGVLLQDNDMRPLTGRDLKVVSKRKPTEEEMRAPAVRLEGLQAREVQCNSLCAQRPDGRRGRRPDEPRGLLQDRRDEVGACRSQGTVAASDAFFPFPDGVEEIAKAGATAIIQPGGSVRDQEVIDSGQPAGLGDGADRRAALPALEKRYALISLRKGRI